MLQACFNPRTIHRQHNIALTKKVALVNRGVVCWPLLYIIPSKAALDDIVSSEKANGRTMICILRTLECKSGEKVNFCSEFRRFPPFAALKENFIQVAFKEFTGVQEVLFGVGFGLGNGVKGFVENAHDPPLFGEGRKGSWNFPEFTSRKFLKSRTCSKVIEQINNTYEVVI